MNVEDLFLALSDIQQKKIETAYRYNISEKSLHKRYFKMVACIALFAIVVSVVGYRNLSKDNTISTEKTSGDTEKFQVEESDKSSIVDEYQFVIYNDIEYAYAGDSVKSTDIAQYLAEGTAYSTSRGNISNEKKCKVYSVDNEDSSEFIAVKFNEIYYLYTRSGE